MVGRRRRGGANDKEAGESGEEGRMVLKAGFNQQQAVGNEITIPPLSDRCHVKLCTERGMRRMTGIHDKLTRLFVNI